MVLSPSQDSFYNALPGLITVEEGATPSSQTEHLMNAYFQPSVLPNGQRRNGSTKHVHGVHLPTPAIAATSVGTGVSEEEGGRVNKAGTTTKEPSATVAKVSAAGHHTSHSGLPVSPGELSAKEASTIDVLSSLSDHQSTLTEESRIDQVSGGSSTANGSGEMNYRQLMQRSISQGMPGIMNKVINESKHDSSNVVPTSAQTEDSSNLTSQARSTAADRPRIKPLYDSPGMRHKTREEGREKLKVASESVKLRTLICSPMETASRKFPEFVFAPGATPATSTSTNGDFKGTNGVTKIATAAGSHGYENQNLMQNTSQMVQSNVSLSTVTVCEGKVGLHSEGSSMREKPAVVDGLKCDTKVKSLVRRLEFDYENDQVKSKSHTKTKNCNQTGAPTATTIREQDPYVHYSTATRATLPVMAETTLTISFKYHSRASLYPSFLRSAYYSTEMDIMESLHTLLDMKFKEHHPQHVQEKRQRCSQATVQTTEGLLDEARKSQLIFSQETPKKANVSLKRPHSFHYRRTKSEVNSAESANLEPPIKRDFLLRKAAEAVKQRKKKSFSEKESDLDALLEEQRSKLERMKKTAMVHAMEQSSRQMHGSNSDHAKSMENLMVTDARCSTIPESSPNTQKYLSSSSYSLHALPTRHASFRESLSSSQRSTSQRRALPRRSKSFHESSKSSQSLEALHIKSGLSLREEGDEELLYTFERKKRPVTVLVRSNSSLTVHDGQTDPEALARGANLSSLRMKYQPSSNLVTMKASSSQALLALSEVTENNQRGNRLVLEGAKGYQKRYSRNRPTSAPSERPSQSRGTTGTSSDRGLDGLMSSIHLKADRLWWYEL